MNAGRPMWFSRHRGLAVAVAIGLFGVVSIIRALEVSSSEGATILFVLPIALLAAAFGRIGGLIAAAVGYALFAIFTVFDSNENVYPLGWTTRAVAMFLLGGLLGAAVDHGRANHEWALAEQRRRLELENQARRSRAALEINDSLIQGMTVAKWMVETSRNDHAVDVLETTITEGGRLVTELLRAGPEDGAKVHIVETEANP